MKARFLLMALGLILCMGACTKNTGSETVEWLEVNNNNISGKWELVEWNGRQLEEGSYFQIELVRNDETFTIWQNMDSFQNIAHEITGRYSLSTDPAKGSIIEGIYDHDSDFWNHSYIIRDLTKDSMLWIATDDEEFTQLFSRID